MRSLKLVLLVVVAITGLALGTGVGASAGKGNTSGVHVRDVVLHGGANAYVRMPDRIKRIVRTADTPAFSCAGATTKVNNETEQTCRWPASYKGAVTCLQASLSPRVTQTCDASQANTTQNNTALIIQIIWSPNPKADQDGTQIVRLRQTNGSGANNAGISQYVKQSKGPGTPDDTEEANSEPAASPTMSAAQSQESHQTVHLRQITSGAGANNAAVLQFLRQRERISNAGTVTQSQNTAQRPESCVPDATDELVGVTVDANANQCILANQTSSSGPLNLLLTGDYNQFQRGSKATGGSQTQGVPFTGGGDIGLTQLSTGLAKITTIQREDQTQRAIDANLFQSQNGPRKGAGSTQGTNPNDTWTGSQTSTQVQTSTTSGSAATAVPSGNQTNFLQYFGDSAGDVRATQTANQNGEVTNFGCPKPGIPIEGPNHSCRAQVVCTSSGDGEVGVQQSSSTCLPNCPEGFRWNPDTQQCETIDCGECTTTIESTPSTPVYAYRR